jgi:hypothetical protein
MFELARCSTGQTDPLLRARGAHEVGRQDHGGLELPRVRPVRGPARSRGPILRSDTRQHKQRNARQPNHEELPAPAGWGCGREGPSVVSRARVLEGVHTPLSTVLVLGRCGVIPGHKLARRWIFLHEEIEGVPPSLAA